MVRLGTLLCLVALATVQVPLIACVSDCHEVVVAGLVKHACHDPHPCGVRFDHAEHVGCQGEHDGHEDGHPAIPPEPSDAAHAVIQVPVVVAGAGVVLPAPTVASFVALPEAGVASPLVMAALPDRGPPAADPGLRLGSVRLLR